jgi:hypothetical protein
MVEKLHGEDKLVCLHKQELILQNFQLHQRPEQQHKKPPALDLSNEL